MATDFIHLTKSISTNIQAFSYNTQKIHIYASKIGTPQDSDQPRNELRRLVDATEELAGRIRDQLKSLDLAVNSALIHPNDQRDRRLLARRFGDQFLSMLAQFQTQQGIIVVREKEAIKRTQLSGQQTSRLVDVEDGPVSSAGNSSVAGQVALISISDETPVDLEAIRQRERQLRRLERDIVNVNQIFKDMAKLVGEQGDTIAKIEDNIMKAAIHVEQGNAELVEAEISHTKSGHKKIICLIVALAAFIILGLSVGLAVFYHLK